MELDNPVWNALNTANKALGSGTEAVKYYHPNISPFVGLEENTPENLGVLYELVPPKDGVYGLVAETEPQIPKPWTLVRAVPIFQMVCAQPKVQREFREPLVPLSNIHIAQMMALTTLANPGPFEENTIAFGHYEGIFEGEQLVAMAGQRMHLPPYAEISAVCTHPNFRGRGHAQQLMASQINRMHAQGTTPFLHVAKENLGAIKIYEGLGFTTRKALCVYLLKK